MRDGTHSSKSTRRVWLLGVLALPVAARAADTPLLAETDAEAIALDYKADAARVDRAKFPAYATGQTCSNCSLYAGEPGAATGGCGLFFGKEVAAKGWCRAWEKKDG